MARAKTRTKKRTTTRPRAAKKKAAPRKKTARRAAPAASRQTAELRAEIRRLRLEILALQAKLGEVPAITFEAAAEEPAVV